MNKRLEYQGLTVGDLVEYLRQFHPNAKVYFGVPGVEVKVDRQLTRSDFREARAGLVIDPPYRERVDL